MNELPEVINLDEEMQKAREASDWRLAYYHFHGYTLRDNLLHFLFCNRRIFGDGCTGHFPRTCKDCRKTTGLEKTDKHSVRG